MRFDYSNSTYNNYEHSYANLYCAGDIAEGNCTYDVVDDCDHLVVGCYIGTCTCICNAHIPRCGNLIASCCIRLYAWYMYTQPCHNVVTTLSQGCGNLAAIYRLWLSPEEAGHMNYYS